MFTLYSCGCKESVMYAAVLVKMMSFTNVDSFKVNWMSATRRKSFVS